MSTRRRIGVSLATTEAARRALMQPVPCWEKVWETPENIVPGSSTLKVYKWVKTDRQQQFSDDEDEVDVPLAPLPDEIEVVDGDEDDADESAIPPSITAPPDTTAQNTEAQPTPAAPLSPMNPPSPPQDAEPEPEPGQLLSLQPEQNAVDEETHDDALDASLKPLDPGMVDTTMDSVDIPINTEADIGEIPEGVDMSALGPDGMAFEGAHDLTQIEGGDDLLGGSVMDSSGDPFTEQEFEGLAPPPPPPTE